MARPELIRRVRLAIVGCGAIAELQHLPAALSNREVEVTVLIDQNFERAKKIAAKFGVPKAQPDIVGIERLADAAIIATPPGAHAALSIELMERGLHVLVEKPLANSSIECQQMIEAAKRVGRVLAVGMVRRFYWVDRFIQGLVSHQVFGRVTSFRVENGYPFEWPSSSRFILSKSEAGGGVLMGLGCHVLDIIFWWLGEPVGFEFHSDAEGGMDADCRLTLAMRSGAKGVIELSRTRRLENRYVIHFEHARVEASLVGNVVNIITPMQLRVSGTVGPDHKMSSSMADNQPIADQLQDFLEAIRTGRKPGATAEEVFKSIQFIESCYLSAKPWRQSWLQPVKF